MSIGLDTPRVDGVGKLTGRTRYVDDIEEAGMWYGGTVRSPIARGRIRGITFDASINWKEYVVVDHRDLPGPNEVQLIEHDQPVLAAGEFRHKWEPIVLIAHPTREGLRRALRGIRVEVEALPAVLDPMQKLTPELVQHGKDNVFKRIDIRKGEDPEKYFASAAHVVEGVYFTGSQEHVYLETQGMIAHYEADGKLVVRGSMQCPFYVLKSLSHSLNREPEQIRVVQTATGGGFGGKEDYPSHLALHAAALSAKRGGGAVKIVYDRQEDMAATTKRHPSVVRHRTALDREGRLLAMDVEVILDGGAYVTLSPVVLSRGCIHAAGPYKCENLRLHGEARLTNTPPNGAFRGFGAPQTIFAVERHMDVIAGKLGIDPVELRRRNFVHDGDTMATGQVVKDGVDMGQIMDRGLREARYHERRADHARFNAAHPYLRRGVGFATFMHGAGFTGSGETMLKSEAWVEGMADGSVEVLVANTDMGQGTEQILKQVAAEALGVGLECVRIAEPDTGRVPNSGPTVASRTAMVVGKLIERACGELKAQVGGLGRSSAGGGEPSPQPSPGVPGEGDEHRTSNAEHRTSKADGLWAGDPGEGGRGVVHHTPRGGVGEAIREWHRGHPGERLLGKAKYSKPESIQWDDATYKGDAYAAYSWAVYVADVEVDLRTYNTRVNDFVALQEVGRVIHPTLARGQIQGGVAQGIGWALTEEVVLDGQGAMKNAQLTNYIIPTSGDLPEIRVFFEERPSGFGPGGAKGIGELPMDGPAPAVVNAVASAVGAEGAEGLVGIPVTAERLMAVVGKRS